MKNQIDVTKNSDGSIQQGTIRNPRKTTFEIKYDDAGLAREIILSGRSNLSVAELYNMINKEIRIRTMSEPAIDTWHDRGTYKEWLADGSYTERWEQGFRPWLYHGRTGSYWRTESYANLDFKDWTNPIVEYLPNDYHAASEEPWRKHLLMRNQHPVTKQRDQLYVGFPKAHHRQAMMFEAKLPAPIGNSPTNLYVGFEVNSGGAFAGLAALSLIDGAWELRALNPARLVTADNTIRVPVTLNYPDAWARYALVFDPPYFMFFQSSVANSNLFDVPTICNLGEVRFKGIPFFANEYDPAVIDPLFPGGFAEFKIGDIWIYELESPQLLLNTLNGNLEAERTPNIWRSIGASAVGSTEIWDPGATHKFRLMGGTICVSGRSTLAAAGIETLQFFDGANPTNIVYEFALPAAVAAIPLNFQIPIDLLKNGYLSTTMGNKLYVDLGTALTAGAIRVTVWGTEEFF